MEEQTIETAEGVRIKITDQREDNFIRDVVSIYATHPDGYRILWELPKRLMLRLDVCQAVSEEIVAELHERVEGQRRLGL